MQIISNPDSYSSVYQYNDSAEFMNAWKTVPSVEEHTIVFTNISDTLYTSASLLTDKKNRTLVQELTRETLAATPELADKVANYIEGSIVRDIGKALAHSQAPEAVKFLQDAGTPVLGFTKKKWGTDYLSSFGSQTYQHVLDLGIDLRKSAKMIHNMQSTGATLSDSSLVPDETNDHYTFGNGIIFVKGSRGEALSHFLDDLKPAEKPRRIVFIENTEAKSMKEFEAVAKAHQVATLIFLTFDRPKIEPDRDLIWIQTLEFMKTSRVLSDREASDIKLANPDFDHSAPLKAWILDNAERLAKLSV